MDFFIYFFSLVLTDLCKKNGKKIFIRSIFTAVNLVDVFIPNITKG